MPMFSAWLLILIQSVFCHPSVRNVGGHRQPAVRNNAPHPGPAHHLVRSSSNIGTPNPVRTTFDVSVLNGEAVSVSGDVITLRSGQMIKMTCKVTYHRDLGKHFFLIIDLVVWRSTEKNHVFCSIHLSVCVPEVLPPTWR